MSAGDDAEARRVAEQVGLGVEAIPGHLLVEADAEAETTAEDTPPGGRKNRAA